MGTDADGDTDVLGLPGHGQPFHARAQVLGHHACPSRIGARQQGEKLFASVATDEILPAQAALQALRDRRQNRIARHMAVGTVDALEPVDVHHQ